MSSAKHNQNGSTSSYLQYRGRVTGEAAMGFTQQATPRSNVTKAKADDGSPQESAAPDQQLVVLRLKELLERERFSILHQVDQRISYLTHEVLSEVENSQLTADHFFRGKEDKYRKRTTDKAGILPEKVFQARNSTLTDLFHVQHISTLYHICIVVLLHLFLTTLISDLITHGRIDVGMHIIHWNFHQFLTALCTWLPMKMATIFIFPIFSLWAGTRKGMSGACHVLLWDALFSVLGLVYMILFLAIPPALLIRYDIAPGMSLALLMEQIRLVMKTYAFLRSNCGRAVTSNPPEFSKYLYFLFAPTLVYRDEYPRTSRVRWSVVLRHFTELLGVIFYITFIIEKYMMPPIREIRPDMPLGQVLLAFLTTTVPSCMAFICAWFGLLHAWMNAWAEMLCFADRMFYKDWWNSCSFAEYYKTWNIVVHDWLYQYIYKDACEKLTGTRRKVAATWLVFTVSALFHEYILALTFRFFYPALFIAFGLISTCLFFIPSGRSAASGNVMLWGSFCLGPGIVASFYMLEHFARLQCASTTESPLQDFFLPRSWTCYGAAPVH